MATYKNISDLPQTVVGIGVVKPGETVKVDGSFENPNFKVIEEVEVQDKEKVSKKSK